MNTIIPVLTTTFLEFILYRTILVLIGAIFTHLKKMEKHLYHTRELEASIILYILFTLIYFETIYSYIEYDVNAYLDIYILYCIYAIFSVCWAYFSWDMDHIKAVPQWAKFKDVIIKKGVLYFIVFVFILIMGYHQTMVFLGEAANPIYSIANLSIFTGIIALDRVFNQIYLYRQNKE